MKDIKLNKIHPSPYRTIRLQNSVHMLLACTLIHFRQIVQRLYECSCVSLGAIFNFQAVLKIKCIPESVNTGSLSSPTLRPNLQGKDHS